MTNLRLLLCSLAVSAVIGCASPAETAARPATVCSLAQDSGHPARAVRLRATVSTDMMHGMYLKDPACPSFALRVGTTPDQSDGSVEEFLSDLYNDSPGFHLRTYQVDITGQLSNTPAARRFHILRVHSYRKASPSD